MIHNRITHGIPFDEIEISKAIMGSRAKSSFLKPTELVKKSSDNTDYRVRKPGIDYNSFGKRKEIKI